MHALFGFKFDNNLIMPSIVYSIFKGVLERVGNILVFSLVYKNRGELLLTIKAVSMQAQIMKCHNILL